MKAANEVTSQPSVDTEGQDLNTSRSNANISEASGSKSSRSKTNKSNESWSNANKSVRTLQRQSAVVHSKLSSQTCLSINHLLIFLRCSIVDQETDQLQDGCGKG